jgi:hypothetical protein
MSVELELFVSRSVEVAFESLPSAVMQVYAYVTTEKKTHAALFSIFCSIVTTSFVATVMSWDMDTSPTSRKYAPHFYGYVKDNPNARTLTFFSMLVLTCAHVSMKLISFSLMMIARPLWLLGYLVFDYVVLNLGVKIARRDFRYWLNISGPASLYISVLTRVTNKVSLLFFIFIPFTP